MPKTVHEYVGYVIEKLKERKFPFSMINLFRQEVAEIQTYKEVNRRIVRLGFLEAEDAAKLLAEFFGVEYYDYFANPVDPSLTKEYLSAEGANVEAIVLDIDKENKVVSVGFVNPDPVGSNVMVVKNVLVNQLGQDWNVRIFCVSEPAYKKFAFTTFNVVETSDLRSEVLRLKEDKNRSPDELLLKILAKAVYEGASDIHFEPGEEGRLRVRKDGILITWLTMPPDVYSRLMIRLMSHTQVQVDKARYIPQDGNLAKADPAFLRKLRSMYKITDVDFRVSFYPNQIPYDDYENNSCVIRILDRKAGVPPLEKLGFSQWIVKKLEDFATRSNGIFIITGPTGSGKSTTLYSMMRLVNAAELNIITIEDPVEYMHPLWKQGQVNEARGEDGLNFRNALRAILRHDPDVVLLGEIRDTETAEHAVRAANTGHLVLTTLHTNNAPLAVLRLFDLGIQKFFIQTTILGILAQRLVRKTCVHCAEDKEITELQRERLRNRLMKLGLPEERASKILSELVVEKVGKGCTKCAGTGYLGRTAVGELLEFTPAVEEALNKDDFSLLLKRIMLEQNERNAMLLDAIERVKQGVTTVEEVLRWF